MEAASPPYLPRLVEPRLRALLGELPAVLLVGPRAAGKTTTAAQYAATIIRLDREAEAAAFRADPDAAMRSLAEPILLDEWQMVPGVLGAVKRAVDEDTRPGRFLITGSVRADLEAETWPGTGRLVRLALFGLTVREQQQSAGAASFFERIRDAGSDAALAPVRNPPDLRGYLEHALRSGFPEPALRLAESGRAAWLEGYLDQLLTRDVALVDAGRDPERLRRYLTAYATTTAEVVDDKTLWEAAGINRKTALAYERLLLNLFVVDRVPAWWENRLKQLVRSPKRHLVDPGLAAAALSLDVTGVLRRGSVLGPMLETFVMSQLRAEAAASPLRPRLFHARSMGGRHEVDIIVELGSEDVIGIEVKATAAPAPTDAKHLAWLRDTIGDRFVAGIVLHTGPRAFSLGPRLVAAPIATLWAT